MCRIYLNSRRSPLSLEPGARVGSYEVSAKVGEGGMGEVSRARDTKLNRDVALKVLLPEVTSDPERLARFRREAQVLASLNHPNIGQIYGFEESPAEAGHYASGALVMELVDGETLAERLARGRSVPRLAERSDAQDCDRLSGDALKNPLPHAADSLNLCSCCCAAHEDF